MSAFFFGMRYRHFIGCVLIVSFLGWIGWLWWTQSDPNAILNNAIASLNLGAEETVENASRRLWSAQHSDHALLLDGMLLARRGRNREAIDAFSRVSEKSSLRPMVVAETGKCYLSLSDPLAAARAFHFLLQLEPRSVDATRGLAAAYYDIGTWPDCVEYCKKWAELSPDDGRPFRFIANIHYQLRDFDSCIEACEEALKRTLKENIRNEVRQELIESKIARLEFTDALRIIETLPKGESIPLRFTFQAQALHGLGKIDEALAAAEIAVEKSGDSFRPHQILGKILLDRNQFDRAVKSLLNAQKLNPNNYESTHALAQAYGALGRTTEAKQAQQLADRLRSAMDSLTELTKRSMESPKDASVHRQMADRYDVLGMPELAKHRRRLAEIFEKQAKLTIE